MPLREQEPWRLRSSVVRKKPAHLLMRYDGLHHSRQHKAQDEGPKYLPSHDEGHAECPQDRCLLPLMSYRPKRRSRMSVANIGRRPHTVFPCVVPLRSRSLTRNKCLRRRSRPASSRAYATSGWTPAITP
jgi:hypothetical protein